jgi:hypothetical protein
MTRNSFSDNRTVNEINSLLSVLSPAGAPEWMAISSCVRGWTDGNQSVAGIDLCSKKGWVRIGGDRESSIDRAERLTVGDSDDEKWLL